MFPIREVNLLVELENEVTFIDEDQVQDHPCCGTHHPMFTCCACVLPYVIRQLIFFARCRSPQDTVHAVHARCYARACTLRRSMNPFIGDCCIVKQDIREATTHQPICHDWAALPLLSLSVLDFTIGAACPCGTLPHPHALSCPSFLLRCSLFVPSEKTKVRLLYKMKLPIFQSKVHAPHIHVPHVTGARWSSFDGRGTANEDNV